MNEKNFSTSACRFCRFYRPEGRRGGLCETLGVPVQSSWKACSLACSPFETTLTKLENIFNLDASISRQSSSQNASELPKLNANSSFQPKVVPQLD